METSRSAGALIKAGAYCIKIGVGPVYLNERQCNWLCLDKSDLYCVLNKFITRLLHINAVSFSQTCMNQNPYNFT